MLQLMGSQNQIMLKIFQVKLSDRDAWVAKSVENSSARSSFFFFNFYWNVFDLLYYVRFRCTTKWCFPGGSEGKASVCLQCRRPRFNPRVRKIPWRRNWQLTPVLLHGKFHVQRRLVGYSPWDHRVADDWATSLPHIYIYSFPDYFSLYIITRHWV